MLHILWTIIIGAIIGVIAKLIHPGKENMGFFATILLGIGGALAFTFLGRVIGLYREGQSAGSSAESSAPSCFSLSMASSPIK